MTTKNQNEFAEMLRGKSLRATPQRLQLLDLLTKAKGPMGIAELQQMPGAKTMDTVTFYRNLETLTEAGLVRLVNLRHGHTDYELAQDGEHHHHIVCTNCKRVEDFDWCPDSNVRNHLLKNTGFKSLNDHALEFFGLCKQCA